VTRDELTRIESALRKTTEFLVRELARPTDVVPDWSNFEWRVARAVATIHGVSALLAHMLRWQSPESWRQFLAEQSKHTATRHRRMQDVLADIGNNAVSRGIPVVPLKGGALDAIRRYEPGFRPMADLDLLVRGEDEQRTARMLESLGFHEAFVTERHRVFTLQKAAPAAAFGEHAGNYIKIELHTRIAEELPVRVVDISALLLGPSPVPGLNPYPSSGALMGHLLLHSAAAMTGRVLRMIQLQDIARLSARMTQADWGDLLTRFSTPERRAWWVWPPLSMAARYFPGIPEEVLSEAAVGVPRLLRRACARDTISDLSFSALWFKALPGIEWADSFGEKLALTARRVVPPRHAEHKRMILAREEPYLADQNWPRMSHLRRLWTWATSRQARPPTLHVVRAALAQPH
jgi:hypothetical protein